VDIVTVADASGACAAGCRGQVVVIVDVIDFSTSLEACLLEGALEVYGAAGAGDKPPVPVDPVQVGRRAAVRAKELGAPVIVLAEPRIARDEERLAYAGPVLAGLAAEGLGWIGPFPNQGAETVKYFSPRGAVVVAASSCGGAAFEAAWHTGADVLTATVARVGGLSGFEIACQGVRRALARARALGTGVALAAASSKSLEDVLATQYLAQLARRFND